MKKNTRIVLIISSILSLCTICILIANRYSYIAYMIIAEDFNSIPKHADKLTFKPLRYGCGSYDGLILYKDKNGVYTSYYTGDSRKIENADPKTFRLLDDPCGRPTFPYAKDKNHIFFNNEIVDEAELSSFKVINSYYGKDSDNVYFMGKRVDKADPESFKLIKTQIIKTYEKDGEQRNNYLSDFFSIDNNQVYFMGKIIQDANPNTFKLYSGSVGIDDKFVYFTNHKIPNADPNTFEVLDIGCGHTMYRDKNAAYKLTSDYKYEESNIEIIDFYDMKSFEYLGECSHYTKDKNGIYYNHEKIEGADIKTFEVYFPPHEAAKDKNGHYYKGERR